MKGVLHEIEKDLMYPWWWFHIGWFELEQYLAKHARLTELYGP